MPLQLCKILGLSPVLRGGKHRLFFGAFALSMAGFSPSLSYADDQMNLAGRCASRLAITLTGSAPSAELSAAAKPQDLVDQLIASEAFNEQFARFLNASFNAEPGANTGEDATYHVAKHVLVTKAPYKNIFVGPYALTRQGQGANAPVVVSSDPNGLGYFRSSDWMNRYAGNEDAGLRLIAAYHMVNNVLGTTVAAVTNQPGADTSATGRAAAGCRGCHFDAWFALDPLAEVLSRTRRNANNVLTGFTPPPPGPKTVLGGKTVNNDKELIETMVNSEEFVFNACQLSFKFLYDREVNSCEAAVFDRCITEFKATGMIQSALASIAKDPTFCQ